VLPEADGEVVEKSVPLLGQIRDTSPVVAILSHRDADQVGHLRQWLEVRFEIIGDVLTEQQDGDAHLCVVAATLFRGVEGADVGADTVEVSLTRCALAPTGTAGLDPV
jgi:hypothetical protein